MAKEKEYLRNISLVRNGHEFRISLDFRELKKIERDACVVDEVACKRLSHTKSVRDTPVYTFCVFSSYMHRQPRRSVSEINL